MALFRLREVQYAVESAVAENAGTPGSLTYSKNIPVLEATFKPERAKLDNDVLLSRRDDTIPGILGERTGKVMIKAHLCGHNTAPTGAVTKTWLAELLEAAFGGYSAGAGTVGVAAASDADTIVVNSTASWAAGQLGRLGAKGDTRGDGQAFAVSSIAATPARIELATGMAAACADADVVYPMMTIYPKPGSEATVRFLLAHAVTGVQYHALGCQLESIVIAGGNGVAAEVTLNYNVGYWVRSAVTIPSAVALEACQYALSLGGSLFLSANSTRAVVTAQSFNFKIETGLSILKGPVAGQLTDQSIYNYERTRTIATLEYTKPLDLNDEALYDADLSDTVYRRILATRVPSPGKAWAIYMPNAYLISPRPAPEDFEQRLNTSFVWRGRELTTGSADLDKSSWRLGLG